MPNPIRLTAKQLEQLCEIINNQNGYTKAGICRRDIPDVPGYAIAYAQEQGKFGGWGYGELRLWIGRKESE